MKCYTCKIDAPLGTSYCLTCGSTASPWTIPGDYSNRVLVGGNSCDCTGGLTDIGDGTNLITPWC